MLKQASCSTGELTSKRAYGKKKIVRESRYCLSVICKSVSNPYSWVERIVSTLDDNVSAAVRCGTHLGVSDTCPIQKAQQVKQRQPGDQSHIYFAQKLAFVDLRGIDILAIDASTFLCLFANSHSPFFVCKLPGRCRGARFRASDIRHDEKTLDARRVVTRDGIGRENTQGILTRSPSYMSAPMGDG